MNEFRTIDSGMLDQFFDNATIGFSLLDQDLRYIHINPALADINGIDAQDHIGRLQHEVIPQVDEVIARTQRRVMADGVPSRGNTVRVETAAQPGVLREFEVDYFPVPAGDGSNNLGCCVYESANSAVLLDALKAQTARSRAYADNLNFFLASLRSDGSVQMVNAPALDIAGLTMSDVRDRLFWDCPWFDYDSTVRETMRKRVQGAMAGELQRFDLTVQVKGGELVEVDVQLAPVMRNNGHSSEIVASGVDISERREAERQREIRHAELQHRIGNIFSNVHALTRKIASQSKDLEDFVGNFDPRFIALARTNDMLVRTEWSDMPVRDLIAAELSPYGDGGESVDIRGPNCVVTAKAAPMLGLAIHELATNAAKHGAFSTEEGAVAITLESDENGMLVAFDWHEQGGPQTGFDPHENERTGFGSVLLNQIVPRSVGLEATMEWRDGGMHYRLT